MLEEAISVLSVWASMSSWLTSTLLFLLLNLMIFTIAFTSGFATHKPTHHHHSNADLRQQPPHQHLQTQLTRTPSILQRFKSLNFYNYIPSPQPPTTEIHHNHNHAPPSPPPTVAPAPETETHVAEEAIIEEEDEGPTMDEIYSRIIQSKGNNSAHYGRQNSDTKPAGGEIPVRLPRKIKKSASDKSAFNHFGAVEESGVARPPALVEERENAAAEEEEEVDARADDFINKFRQQLKMQRLDSIQRVPTKI